MKKDNFDNVKKRGVYTFYIQFFCFNMKIIFFPFFKRKFFR